jgi:hypothetical protein
MPTANNTGKNDENLNREQEQQPQKEQNAKLLRAAEERRLKLAEFLVRKKESKMGKRSVTAVAVKSSTKIATTENKPVREHEREPVKEEPEQDQESNTAISSTEQLIVPHTPATPAAAIFQPAKNPSDTNTSKLSDNLFKTPKPVDDPFLSETPLVVSRDTKRYSEMHMCLYWCRFKSNFWRTVTVLETPDGTRLIVNPSCERLFTLKHAIKYSRQPVHFLI